MAYFDHVFDARISRHMVGTLAYTVVFLDPSIEIDAPDAPRRPIRADLEVAGIPFRAAWQSSKGRRYVMLSKKLLRDAGAKLGDRVEVAFRIVGDDDVQVPDELATAIARSKRLTKAWESLTPGRQRGLTHLVHSAKTAPTRAKRVARVIDGLTDPEKLAALGSPTKRATGR
jgi:hypothetical protein